MLFFDGTIKLFADIADNPYLLSHNKIYKQWHSLYRDLKFFRNVLNSSDDFDSKWQEKNFPFNELTERLFAFYTTVRDSEIRQLDDNSATATTYLDNSAAELFRQVTDIFSSMNNETREVTQDIEKIDVAQEFFSDNSSNAELDSAIYLCKYFASYMDSLNAEFLLAIEDLKSEFISNRQPSKSNSSNMLLEMLPLSKHFYSNNRNKFPLGKGEEFSPLTKQQAREMIKEAELFYHNSSELVSAWLRMTRKVEQHHQQGKQ